MHWAIKFQGSRHFRTKTIWDIKFKLKSLQPCLSMPEIKHFVKIAIRLTCLAKKFLKKINLALILESNSNTITWIGKIINWLKIILTKEHSLNKSE